MPSGCSSNESRSKAVAGTKLARLAAPHESLSASAACTSHSHCESATRCMRRGFVRLLPRRTNVGRRQRSSSRAPSQPRTEARRLAQPAATRRKRSRQTGVLAAKRDKLSPLRELDGRETIGSSASRPLFSPGTHGDVALEAERVARTPPSPRAAAFRACALKTRAKTRRRSPQNSATSEPTAYSRHRRARRRE